MSDQQIPAIETRYAGCHFRSRLEARWAVFLDTLGIRWEYEPQGFELTWRLRLDEAPLRYLPDFYLPDLELWVEVKGDWTLDECDRLCNAAAALSAPGGGCGDGGDMLVLGPLPRPGTSWSPWVLHMHKGDLQASPWAESAHSDRSWTIGRDVGGDGVYDEPGMLGLEFWRHILLSGTTGDLRYDLRYDGALTAARSARFEHGHSGAS